MTRLGVLGATGYTGRFVAEEAIGRGLEVVAAGRDLDRVRAAVPGATRHERVDVSHRTQLDDFLAGIDVLATTVGPFDVLGRGVLAAAVEQTTAYVDVTGEQPFIRWAQETWDGAAADRGVTAVLASGFDYLPGDLAAALAAEAVTGPEVAHEVVDELHIAYVVDAPGGPLGASSRGTRTTIATMLGRPMLARVRGTLEEEPLGEARRLAWFPRPLGPRHAAGIPGGEALFVPRHVPGVSTVRTYIAAGSFQSELLQLLGNASRWGPARRWVSRLLERGSDGPGPKRRAETRWACVAEARAGDDVARAWVSGTDPYGFTAAAAVLTAQVLAEGDARAVGVVSPAMALAPRNALDRLADLTRIQWGVVHP